MRFSSRQRQQSGVSPNVNRELCDVKRKMTMMSSVSSANTEARGWQVEEREGGRRYSGTKQINTPSYRLLFCWQQHHCIAAYLVSEVVHSMVFEDKSTLDMEIVFHSGNVATLLLVNKAVLIENVYVQFINNICTLVLLLTYFQRSSKFNFKKISWKFSENFKNFTFLYN